MKPVEKKLLNIYRTLAEPEKKMLSKFADFLQNSSEETIKPLATPVTIEPKKDETVVGALKRLSSSYSMLDKTIMLNKTSGLMAQHVLQGRNKIDVIIELEAVFIEQYEELIKVKSEFT